MQQKLQGLICSKQSRLGFQALSRHFTYLIAHNPLLLFLKFYPSNALWNLTSQSFKITSNTPIEPMQYIYSNHYSQFNNNMNYDASTSSTLNSTHRTIVLILHFSRDYLSP